MVGREGAITRRASLLLLFAFCASLAPAPVGGQRFQPEPPPPTGRWYHVDREQGIVVKAHERPDQELPLLRAIGVVEADPYLVAAVLGDADRLHQWMAHTAESRLIARDDELSYRFYQRMGAPWPVSDRDVVMAVRVTVDPARGLITARFRDVRDPRVAPRDGIVRMPRLRGRYQLKALPGARTRADLLIDADPGGALPHWLVRATTRSLPLDMLLTLRERIAAVGANYAPQAADYRARHGALATTE